MRKIILQMMTTLNGRLDDPMQWVHEVSEDQYVDLERQYRAYDTVLVGRTTYEEMAAYWPGALESGEGSDSNRKMAHHMHDYRKLVFTRSEGARLTPWNNVEAVVTPANEDLAHFLTELKARPGGDIHLSGGAELAQSIVQLGLVDEFSLFVYPTFSPGKSWFARLAGQSNMELLSTVGYRSGVVSLRLAPRPQKEIAPVERFTEMLAD